MKKGEKLQRGKEYKSELLANIKAAGVIDQQSFRQLVETLDKKYLGKEDKSKNIHNVILYEFRKKGVVETVKVGKITLISLKNNSNKVDKKEAKKIVKSVVPLKYPKSKENSSRSDETKVAPVFEKKVKSITLKERIQNVIDSPKKTFTYSELTEIMKFGFQMTTQYLNGINKSCIKMYGQSFGEVDVKAKRFTKNLKLRLDERKIEDKSSKKVVAKEPEKEMKPKAMDEKTVIPEIDFETAYTRFAVAGILKSLGSIVNIEKLSDQLGEYFGLKVDPRLLIIILKEDHEFTLIEGGKTIGLRSDKSWDELKKKYSPKNYTVSILARINMSPEEVRSYFEEAEVRVVSAIQKADNIYELKVDRSVHTRKQLLRLVKSFRDTDKILEKDMEEKLQNYIKEEEERSYKFYCPLEIENL